MDDPIPTIRPLVRASASFRTDADAVFGDELPALIGALNTQFARVYALGASSFSATSVTNLAVSAGVKTLAVQAGKGFVIGQPVLIARTSAPNTWMQGQCAAYNIETGELMVNATSVSGAGNAADWTVSLTSLSASAGPTILRRAVNAADVLTPTDAGKLIDCTGTFTLSAAAVATLGNGWFCYLRNRGTGTVTLDPSGAETVDGVASGAVRGTLLLTCDGAALHAVRLGPMARMEVLTSGTSWSCPLGARTVRVRGTGGGGGGGRYYDDTTPAGGGGGAGYIESLLPTSPGTSYAYTVGGGGPAAAAGNSNGSDGGNTTFTANGSTLTAYGGPGGFNIAAPRVGGAAAGGQINLTGGASFAAWVTGGGLSVGGDTPLGRGGARTGNNLASAVGYGSGGYGGYNSTGAASAGQPGVIILEY